MSGETEEVLRLLPAMAATGVHVAAVTSKRTSSLAKASDVVIELGKLEEACNLGLAPSTSTTAMLAVGDALALTLSRRRRFTAHDFVRFHPGGSLGRKLTKVQDMMRPLSECRIAHQDQSVREVFVTLRRAGRRTGAVMIVNGTGTLVGVFTDSDLARLLEQQSDTALEAPVQHVMTINPHRVQMDTFMPEAIQILADYHISELPVVGQAGEPKGLLDITDVISWMPSGQDRSDDDDEVDRHNDAGQKGRIIPFPASDLEETA